MKKVYTKEKNNYIYPKEMEFIGGMECMKMLKIM